MTKKTFALIVATLSSTIMILSGIIVPYIDLKGDSVKKNDVFFDLMGWGNIDLDTNPDIYTAPFFSIVRLADEFEGGSGSNAITAADFNGDGWIDIAVSSFWTKGDTGGSNISILYNSGGQYFERKFIMPFIKNTYIWDMDAGDFDGDGDDDIIISRYPPGSNNKISYVIEILWNERNHFNYLNRTLVMTISREDGIIEYHIPNQERPFNDWGCPHMAVADFNRDGYDDFVLGTNCAKVLLFVNNRNRTFSYDGAIYDYGTLCKGLATGDFNHDGYPDLLICSANDGRGPINASGYIYLKLNSGPPEYFDRISPGILVTTLPIEEEVNFTLGASSTGTVEALDYNKDGLLDVIFGGDWWIFILIQRKNYTFKPFVVAELRARYLTWADNLFDGGFAVADFNKDGYDDFVQGGDLMARLFINNRTFACITKPSDRTAYVFGKEAIGPINLLIKFPGDKLVVGPVNVTVYCLCQAKKIEFYLNDQLLYTDNLPPFTWRWGKPGFGKYHLYVKAYDKNGTLIGKDSVILWKVI